MTEFGLIVALSILCLVAAGVFMWRAGQEKQRQIESMQRLQSALDRGDTQNQSSIPTTPTPKRFGPPAIFDAWLQRAGYDPTTRIYALIALPAPFMAAVGAGIFGFAGAAIALFVLYPICVTVILRWRIEHFEDQVVAQLPAFLDTVARILSIGSSLEIAFRNASDESKQPLRGITAQMLLRTRAGIAIEDAMNQVAETYAIKDLSFMAAVFYLGMHYGGNARAVLERIAKALRERERGQKELHAMTSETRASAWILSALPILVGTLTLVSNPNYLLGMWSDELGRKLLMAALVMQVIGMWLLFHMAKLRFH